MRARIPLADPATAPAERELTFGPFRLLPDRRILLDGEMPVPLGTHAMEILNALAERPGEIISREELISRGWPDTQVGDDSLEFQVGVLQQALGNGRDGCDQYVKAAPGKGYRLVAEVQESVPPSQPDSDQTLSFGPFLLQPRKRVLLEEGEPVRLGSRAMDILIAFAERPGQLISNRELMALVWPESVVVEANLTVHLSALRRALGDGREGNRYILNAPGQGYRFVAPVTVVERPRSTLRPAPETARQHNLPVQLTRLIGRAGFISTLVQQLAEHRLQTIVGPAGIGKTALALEVAKELVPAYEHGVWLVDLAPIEDPRLVATSLAAALRLEMRSDSPLPSLVAAIGDKQMLIVLDNCEHVIEAAAALAEGVLRGARNVRVLATSREPLRVDGERVCRLPPLDSPPAGRPLNAAEALRFSAVQLFAERAAATSNDFELSDADATSAGDLCRNLDGIPLAIEFAAARIDSFGVRGLTARLDDRLRLLTGGHRTAQPRHRTLSAALDWSYQLLNEEEQRIFRHLAVFVGGFTLEAANGVAADAEKVSPDIAQTIANLVVKSLVAADAGEGDIRFHLLGTMRAYALSKLKENGEADALKRRHAEYYRDLIAAARDSSAGDDFAGAYGGEIDNIRAALNWAFAPGGDRSIAVSLAEATAPIFLEMSLLAECRDWMEMALESLDAADLGTHREVVLQTTLGFALVLTRGLSGEALGALTRARALAETLGDTEYHLRALAGLAYFCYRHEEFRRSLALAREFEAIARKLPDPAATSTANGLLAASYFLLGDYATTLTYAQLARPRHMPAVRRTLIARAGIEHSIWGGCMIAQVWWLYGLPDQAACMTRQVLADAEAIGNPVSLCFALNWTGCNISLKLGDLAAAESSIARLKDHAEKHGLVAQHAFGLGYEGELRAKRGDMSAAEKLLRTAIDTLHQTQHEILYTPFLSSLAEILAADGRIEEGLAAADEAFQRTERSEGRWWTPEALRIKGEILLLSNKDNLSLAEQHFQQSLDLAAQQGAVSWELRTAMSLGRLHHAQGRTRDAWDLLSAVHARFSEGFQSADLQSAALLLADWTVAQNPS